MDAGSAAALQRATTLPTGVAGTLDLGGVPNVVSHLGGTLRQLPRATRDVVTTVFEVVLGVAWRILPFAGLVGASVWANEVDLVDQISPDPTVQRWAIIISSLLLLAGYVFLARSAARLRR